MAKWICIMTLEGGDKFAFSRYKKQFAVVPVDPDTGTVKNAIAWDTREDAEAHLREQLRVAGDNLEKPGVVFSVQEMIEPS